MRFLDNDTADHFDFNDSWQQNTSTLWIHCPLRCVISKKNIGPRRTPYTTITITVCNLVKEVWCPKGIVADSIITLATTLFPFISARSSGSNPSVCVTFMIFHSILMQSLSSLSGVSHESLGSLLGVSWERLSRVTQFL